MSLTLLESNENSGRSLAAARVVSSVSFSVLASVLVEMPNNLLGHGGELSAVGIIFCLLQVALGALSVAGIHLKMLWALALADILVLSSIGIFVLAVPHDPVKAGSLVLWQIYTGLMLMFFTKFRSKDRYSSQLFKQKTENFSALKLWFIKHRKSVTHILVVTIIQTTLVFGFDVTNARLALNVVLFMAFLSVGLSLWFLKLLHAHDTETKRESIVVSSIFFISAIVYPISEDLSSAFLFLFISAVTFVVLSRSPLVREGVSRFRDAPALFVLISFVALIAAGALFLSLPEASASGQSMGAVQAIFTSVSAACVTGLTVLSTGSDLSGFGQIVVLILIQLGGLGIMVLSTFATIAFGGRLGVKTERAFSEFFEAKGARTTNTLVVFIVKSTVIIEAAGAVLLTYVYYDENTGIWEALKNGVFHAISAFCNAGFSLHDSSLILHNNSGLALSVFSILITLGGLGFFVMLEIFSRFSRRRNGPMSVHAKLVLLMTILFTVVGTLVFTVTEWDHAFAGMSAADKFLNGFFHAVTLRTAGFNSVDLTTFTNASFVLMLMFMFVGAAPGGTAGGVKVTTIGVLLSTLPALLRNHNTVSLFKKTLSSQTIYKAASLIILSLSTVCFLWFILLLTQDSDPLKLLFEVFSAVGTVGLSMGVTTELNGFGEIVISIGMFIGRIGPLTVAIALGKENKSKIIYPTTNVMVG